MHWLKSMVGWIVGVVGRWGYPGIVVMMFLESSCFPFPSEVVMIPAGYLAQQGRMNLWIAIAMGIVGSLLGALFNYYLALWLGRPLLIKWGRYFFVSEKNFEKAERFFNRHGEITTFVGRLIPVVRQYISLPAGLARMNMFRFLVLTGIGAGIWVTILAYIGYVVGQNKDLAEKYSRECAIALLAVCPIIVAVYVYARRRRAAGKRQPSQHTAAPPLG